MESLETRDSPMPNPYGLKLNIFLTTESAPCEYVNIV